MADSGGFEPLTSSVSPVFKTGASTGADYTIHEWWDTMESNHTP